MNFVKVVVDVRIQDICDVCDDKREFDYFFKCLTRHFSADTSHLTIHFKSYSKLIVTVEFLEDFNRRAYVLEVNGEVVICVPFERCYPLFSRNASDYLRQLFSCC